MVEKVLVTFESETIEGTKVKCLNMYLRDDNGNIAPFNKINKDIADALTKKLIHDSSNLPYAFLLYTDVDEYHEEEPLEQKEVSKPVLSPKVNEDKLKRINDDLKLGYIVEIETIEDIPAKLYNSEKKTEIIIPAKTRAFIDEHFYEDETYRVFFNAPKDIALYVRVKIGEHLSSFDIAGSM